MGVDKFRVDGKTALIAGSSSGIGRASAEELAAAGADVFLVARREHKLKEVKSVIEQAGGACEYYAADVSVEENCKVAVDTCLKRFGKIDILVNSAGVNTGRADQFDVENYYRVIKIDLDGTFFMIKYAFPCLEKAGCGSIINIASSSAVKAMPAAGVPYTIAKSAIKGLTRMWGKSMAQAKIRINTIHPGLILTELTEGIFKVPGVAEELIKEIPLGRIGQADEIAYCVVYLASPASAFVTGQDFIIDGGFTC
jgi:NAD(P)-dependent dehydrogenase (short-subunit alcohol dehydrogenase family)